jgi:cysteate synthase
MAAVMLEAARVIGTLPSYYFQAVGSGTGAIAVYEACLRLREAPGFPAGPLPVLNLVQNAPFAPIYHAWEDNVPIAPPEKSLDQVNQIAVLHARTLANRKPPYYIGGGVRDVLAHTRGRTHKITNNEAVEAGKLFEELEGIDILPEAAVCVAALLKAVKKGSLPGEDIILVNITGGGTKRIKADYHCRTLEPEFVVEDPSHFRLPI